MRGSNEGAPHLPGGTRKTAIARRRTRKPLAVWLRLSRLGRRSAHRRAREESWSHERFLEAVLSTEVPSRDSHGGESRIKAARFPARKTLEEFDFTFQRSVRKQVIEHLGQLDFLHARQNVVLLGPPGTGKSHLAIAISIRACLAGRAWPFATATEWVARTGRCQAPEQTGRRAAPPLVHREASALPPSYAPEDSECIDLSSPGADKRTPAAARMGASRTPRSLPRPRSGRSESARARSTPRNCSHASSAPWPTDLGKRRPPAPLVKGYRKPIEGGGRTAQGASAIQTTSWEAQVR
jgi:IstB-like ATP binding protein